MNLAQALRKCSASANKEGPMEVGTSAAFVFKNAVIVFAMKEGRKLEIVVSAGVPEYFNEEIDDLLEETK
jgi:hypothetical protein